MRFEIVLHEDGRILTQYLTAGPDARQKGASATVGLEDAEGGDGLEYSSHAPSLDSGAAFLYMLPPSGVLEGQVLDANDGRPLGNVHLLAWNEALGSRTTFTDEQGRYRLELRVGLHAVGVYSPSYGEETRAVQVGEGQSQQLDVSLKSGRALLAPAALDLGGARGGRAVFTVANRGSRDLTFEVGKAPASEPSGGEEPAEGEVPWLSVSPRDGTVAPGEERTVEVTVDRSMLPAGVHLARLLDLDGHTRGPPPAGSRQFSGGHPRAHRAAKSYARHAARAAARPRRPIRSVAAAGSRRPEQKPAPSPAATVRKRPLSAPDPLPASRGPAVTEFRSVMFLTGF